MIHTVTAVLIDGEGEPHFRCSCWLVFSGRQKKTWSIALSADGKRATFSPSVLLPGPPGHPDHLHEFSTDIPVVQTWATLALKPEYHKGWGDPCDDDCHCRAVA